LKKGKLKPQRIDPYSIDSFSTDGTNHSIALRTLPRGPDGLDVAIKDSEVLVALAGAKEHTVIDVSPDDCDRLLTLRDRLLDALTTHRGVHRRVVMATLDDAPLADGEDLGLVVQRLIDAATPIVNQIRAHSLSPNELVIRRLLGKDRREEIFVSTASLLEKLGRLPRNLRSMFAPLGLEWQRARTPVPGEVFVEPPRQVAPELPPEVPLEVPPEGPPEADAPPVIDAPSVVVDAALMAGDPGSPAAPSEATPERPSAEPPRRSRPETKTPIDVSSKDALAATVKRIVGLAREGRTQDAYESYAALFEDSGFAELRAQDQRQVLKLMVLSKNPPAPSFPVLEAYRCALARLQALAADSDDPIDKEMIAICENRLR
jgi:hypothetical protein